MKMKTICLYLLITASLVAQSPKPKSKPEIPEIPDAYQVKLLALVNRQKSDLLKEAQAKEDFRAASEDLSAINTQGNELEKAMFKELKLDPAKYTTQTDASGKLVIVENNAKDSK